MNSILMNQAIQAFLLEDIGQYDLSAGTVFPRDTMGEGVFLAKETGILCGISIPPKVYELLGGNIQFEAYKKMVTGFKKAILSRLLRLQFARYFPVSELF